MDVMQLFAKAKEDFDQVKNLMDFQAKKYQVTKSTYEQPKQNFGIAFGATVFC